MSDADPVLARRERLDRLARAGKGLGYLLLLFACGVFLSGALTNFTTLTVRLVIGALAVSSLLLAPAIVLGYAVRAAQREDARRPRD